MSIDAWMKSACYLPHCLRDFHDQKEVFKAMHERVNVAGNEYAAKVDWVAGQCYVIDIFLWFMARRGYTLQRSRARLPFLDLEADVKATSDARNERAAESLRQWLGQRNGPPATDGPEGGA